MSGLKDLEKNSGGSSIDAKIVDFEPSLIRKELFHRHFTRISFNLVKAAFVDSLKIKLY